MQQMLGRHRQPGAVGGGKGAIGGMGLPDHGRAAAIAPLELGPELDAIGVHQVLEGQFGLLEPQFLALVEADRAPHGEQQGRGEAGEGGFLPVHGPAAYMAHHVVIGEGEADPAIGRRRLGHGDGFAEVIGREHAAEIIEGIGHMQPLVARGVLGHDFELVLAVADFAHRGTAGIFVHHGAQALEEIEVFGARLVEQMLLEIIGVHRRGGGGVEILGLDHRIGFQPQRAEIEIDRIEPEAVDAPLQPEAHIGQQSILHVGIVEVEVGLGDEEIVQVILHAPAVPLPGGATEDGKPVVGRGAVGLGIGPDIPVGARIGAALPAFGEPGVLIRGMGDHLVDDDLEPEGMGLLHQAVEILQRAEAGIDAAIIGHVVAEILHRAGEDRRQPNGVDAQIGDIVEPAGDADEIPYPIAVLVLEGARIDLVDHRAAPPVLVDGGFGRRPWLGHQRGGSHCLSPGNG